MSEEKLLPCPFCGENKGLGYATNDFGCEIVECLNKKCQANGPMTSSFEASHKAWNRRTPDLRALDEAIAKVEKLIKEAYDGEWEMGLTEALEAMQQIRAKYEGK